LRGIPVVVARDIDGPHAQSAGDATLYSDDANRWTTQIAAIVAGATTQIAIAP
jgi:hypothetical protein